MVVQNGNLQVLGVAIIHVRLAIDAEPVNPGSEPLVWQPLAQSKNQGLVKMQFQLGSELLFLRLDFDSKWKALFHPHRLEVKNCSK